MPNFVPTPCSFLLLSIDIRGRMNTSMLLKTINGEELRPTRIFPAKLLIIGTALTFNQVVVGSIPTRLTIP